MYCFRTVWLICFKINFVCQKEEEKKDIKFQSNRILFVKKIQKMLIYKLYFIWQNVVWLYFEVCVIFWSECTDYYAYASCISF